MASSLKQLKAIEQDTEFTVFGYVRQNENNLSLFCNVPDMVTHLCLSYYFHGEYFEKAGDDIKISNDKMTVTKIAGPADWNNSSYGKQWINSSISQIVEWKFKVNKMECGIYICLVSCDNRLNEDCIGYKNKMDFPNYGFHSGGGVNTRDEITTSWSMKNSFKFVENDIISMILDTKQGHLFLQNAQGEKSVVVRTIKSDPEIRYKMAVSLENKSDSVSLVDFKCVLI